MTDLPLPSYKHGHLFPNDKVQSLSSVDLLRGYYIINATFKFPPRLKYPSIPCYVDENTTVYPLEGSCLITGPEYLLAKNQGCVFKLKSVFYIPPSEVCNTNNNSSINNNNNNSSVNTITNTKSNTNTNTNTNTTTTFDNTTTLDNTPTTTTTATNPNTTTTTNSNSNTTNTTTNAKAKAKINTSNSEVVEDKGFDLILPFQAIIKDLQCMRGKYPKGSFKNLLYKEIGNSIYGNVVRGISNKKSFDTHTGKMFRVKGTELSNPILAS